MCQGWLPAKWADCDKHRPPAGVPWNELVKSSGDHDGVACYIRNIDYEVLEMSYRASGKFLYRKDQSAGNHIDLHYIEMKTIIGASCGEETKFVLILREQSGAVHGYPITETELNKYKNRARKLGSQNV